MIDTPHLLTAWSIPAPRNVRLANAGTNNRSYIVDTSAGSYLLRVYQNTNDLERVRYEHALLQQLWRADLSFAVPHPLTATTGNTYVIMVQDGDALVAALFPMIPGREPARGNVAQTAVCGEALGELNQALARVEVGSAFVGPAWVGQSGTVHALVPDTPAAIAQLPLVTGKREHLDVVFHDLVALAPRLYRRIPQQIIHGDYFPSNVLVEGNAVSGILDFEFTSPGPRAMDFAIGLWAFGVSRWRTSDDWPLVETFAAGYQRQITLNVAEIRAIPTLIRLREATSLIHWIGRFRQGLTTEPGIVSRTDRLLEVDDWMRVRGDELVRRIERCAT